MSSSQKSISSDEKVKDEEILEGVELTSPEKPAVTPLAPSPPAAEADLDGGLRAWLQVVGS